METEEIEEEFEEEIVEVNNGFPSHPINVPRTQPMNDLVSQEAEHHISFTFSLLDHCSDLIWYILRFLQTWGGVVEIYE